MAAHKKAPLPAVGASDVHHKYGPRAGNPYATLRATVVTAAEFYSYLGCTAIPPTYDGRPDWQEEVTFLRLREIVIHRTGEARECGNEHIIAATSRLCLDALPGSAAATQ